MNEKSVSLIQDDKLGFTSLLSAYVRELFLLVPAHDGERLRAFARQIERVVADLLDIQRVVYLLAPGFVLLYINGAQKVPLIAGCVGLLTITTLCFLKLPRIIQDHNDRQEVRSVAVQLAVVTFGFGVFWAMMIASVAFGSSYQNTLMGYFVDLSMVGIGAIIFLYYPLAFILYSGMFIINFALIIRHDANFDYYPTLGLAVFLLVVFAKLVVDHTQNFISGEISAERLLVAENAQREQERELTDMRLIEEQSALEARAQIAEARNAIADERAKEMRLLSQQFENNVVAVVEMVGQSIIELGAATERLRELGERTVADTSEVAAVARDTSMAMENIAVSSGALRQSASEIAFQVESHVGISDETLTRANDSRQAITALSQEADDIGGVVAVIESITAQTNLLALNASIEASRAGDAGRGFAVVANEVKSLADQARAAAQKIADQISEIHGSVGTAVDRIERTGSGIENVAHIAGVIAEAVHRQQDATSEISDSARHVSQSALLVNSRMDELSERVRTAGQLSSSLTQTTVNLELQSEQLREKTKNFLERLRAA